MAELKSKDKIAAAKRTGRSKAQNIIAMELQIARTELLRSRLKTQELVFNEKAGKLISADETQRIFTNLVGKLSADLFQIPPRLAALVPVSQKQLIFDEASKMIRAAIINATSK